MSEVVSNQPQDIRSRLLSLSMISNLLTIFLLIIWPGLKTMASIINQEGVLIKKWAYYWITLPYFLIINEILYQISKYWEFLCVIQLILAFLITLDNGYIVRHITVKIVAPLYKKYYKQIKRIPSFITNQIKKIPNLLYLFIPHNKEPEQQPVQQTRPAHRRPNTVQ